MAAFQGAFPLALLFIVIGAVFDFFDGMSARLLHVSSPIGKELDSLADVVTFGVAPSALVSEFLVRITATPLSTFSFSNPDVWLQLLSYVPYLMAAFSALRLAKFNLDERQTMGFIGLPTPANALFWGALVVGPGAYVEQMEWSPIPLYVTAAMTLFSCYLLVSEIPMFALKFKHWGWKGNEVKYIFVISAIALIAYFGIGGIAVAIAWYVVLSILTWKLKPSR